MDATSTLYALGSASIGLAIAPRLNRRLLLSRAKHRSLLGHARIARWLAARLPHYEYPETLYFCSDDAPAEIAQLRRDGFMRLSELFATRFEKTLRASDSIHDAVSDAQFIEAYRVPFQYSALVRKHLRIGS